MANRFLSPFTGGRSLARGGGFSPFMDFQREMNRLFDDVFGREMGAGSSLGGSASMWMTPQIDVTEGDNELRICADIPGVPQEDVDVTVEGDMLTLRGEKKSETEQERGSYHVSERSFGRFQRSIQLPFTPDPEQVRASFDKGVLTVTVPKTGQQTERGRRIEVQSGSSSEPAADDPTKH
jgi:HSP20 family protein